MELWQTALTSGVIVAIVEGIFTLIKMKNAKKSAEREALMFLILDQLEVAGRRSIDRDYATLMERKRLCEMHRTYKRLGGDGYADSILHDVLDLEIKE